MVRDFAPQPETLETADTTFCTTFYEQGKAQPEMCVRFVLDVSKRRMYNETRMEMEGERYLSTLVYQEGRATMKDSFSDEALELPEAQVKTLERTFEQVFEQLSSPETYAPEYERATYDGPVRYGRVIEGVGVTAKTTAPSFVRGGSSPQQPSPQQPSPQQVTAQFIFDDKGRVIGSATEASQGTQGTLLMVYDNPEDPIPFRRFAGAAMYAVDGERVTLTGKTRVTRYRVNEPLNERSLPSRKRRNKRRGEDEHHQPQPSLMIILTPARASDRSEPAQPLGHFSGLHCPYAQ